MNSFLLINQRSIRLLLILILFSLITTSYGFDPLDPNANITIKWDLIQSSKTTTPWMQLKVNIYNYQLYRHIEKPGWKLSWTWKHHEVIWHMEGAEATKQGNCTAFRGGPLPHCCERKPVIVDLMPGAPYNIQTQNCCKGGVLSSMTQDSSMYGAGFQMEIGRSGNSTGFTMPENFTLGIPGYTCGQPFEVPPTKFYSDGGRRQTQAFKTWNVTCDYSQFIVASDPKCCGSLSAFYSSTIVPCPKCSCHCQGLSTTQCIKPGETPSLLQQRKDQNEESPPVVVCSDHMCPIRVHWHIKESYKEYWRVKITVTNLNIMNNYSMWNLVVLHPNLMSVTQVFSFNYKPLNQYSQFNDSGMLWGLQYYNDILLEAGEEGNVQSEILLHKDAGIFSFEGGWAFPRRILFNGDGCVMPLPDDFPRLPNSSHIASTSTLITFFSLLFLLLLFLN